MKKFIIFLITFSLLSFYLLSIPAFARKYKFSCMVCHAPFPHLKDFGEEFAANGYTLPEKEPRRAFRDTGDKLLLLQRQLPVALRIDVYGSYEANKEVNNEFKAPFVMKILSGGNIYKNISYYAYFLFTEEGKIEGLEDAYIAFSNLFGAPVSIIFGQYRVSDPLKPSELRLTFKNYIAYKFRVGLSDIRLSYDRGIMVSYSTGFGTDLSFQIVNGNGIHTPEFFDKDKYKSFAFRLFQSLKNAGFGVFLYYGKEASEYENTVTYLGPDFSFKTSKFELFIQYLRRSDSNPLFLPEAPNEVFSNAWLAEILYKPRGDSGRTFLTLLYNRINSDFPGIDYQTITFNFTYLIARNFKWIAEYTHDVEGKHHRLLSGFISAF